jgi:hypothetical protein
MLMPSRQRRSRRRTWLAAAAAAAVAASAVAAYAVVSSGPPSGQAPGQSPHRPASDGRVPARAAGSSLPSVSTSGWQSAQVDGEAVPVSPSAGPASGAAGLASGFTDTPAGAVLAACNIAVRISGQLGSAIFVDTITRQVTGPGADALLAAAWQEYGQASADAEPGSPGGPAGKLTASLTAFRLTAWSGKAASVTLVATAPGNASEQVTVPVQVRWSGSDWLLVAPSGGAFTGSRSAPGLPPGFTALPGG